jgi:hypothetical protein
MALSAVEETGVPDDSQVMRGASSEEGTKMSPSTKRSSSLVLSMRRKLKPVFRLCLPAGRERTSESSK